MWRHIFIAPTQFFVRGRRSYSLSYVPFIDVWPWPNLKPGHIGGQTGSSSGLPACSLNKNAAINFLRECLTSRQLRVQIYRSDLPSKNSASWTLAVQASPGNLEPLADLLFSNTDILSSPVIASIWIKGNTTTLAGRTVGVAFADMSVRTLGVSEFPEKEEGWGNTESLIIQLGIKEAILPASTVNKAADGASDGEYTQLRDMLERCGVVVSERKRTEFHVKSIEQDINRLLSGERQLAALRKFSSPRFLSYLCCMSLSHCKDPADFVPAQFDMKTALSALNPLLNYLSILDDPSNHAAFKFVTHDLGQFMRLDASAVRALHLFPNPTGIGGGGKSMSLFGLLNRCKTSQGTRLLGRWLKQPLVNLHDIEQRQMLVGVLFHDGLLRQQLQEDHLKAMPDLTRIAKRFTQGAATLEDVVRVYQAMVRLPDILAALEKAEEPPNSDANASKRLMNEIYCLPLHVGLVQLYIVGTMGFRLADLIFLSWSHDRNVRKICLNM